VGCRRESFKTDSGLMRQEALHNKDKNSKGAFTRKFTFVRKQSDCDWCPFACLHLRCTQEKRIKSCVTIVVVRQRHDAGVPSPELLEPCSLFFSNETKVGWLFGTKENFVKQRS